VWQLAHRVPNLPRCTSGSGWQPKQSFGRGLNASVGGQLTHGVPRGLFSRRNVAIRLGSNVVSPVSRWDRSHALPSAPWWTSSLAWQRPSAHAVGVGLNARFGWQLVHSTFTCWPTSGYAVRW